MGKRAIRTILAMGLVIGLLASATSTSALHGDESLFDNPWDAVIAHSYFPWVPNGHEIEGMGEYTGAITIQNLEDEDAINDGVVEVDIHVGQGEGGGYQIAEAIELAPHESQTLSAADLGIPEGDGASVVAAGYLDRGIVCGDYDDPDELEADGYTDTDCEWNEDDEEWENPDQTVDEGVYGRISGVVKNVAPTGGSASTNADDTSVDGYSGMVGYQVTQQLPRGTNSISFDSDGTYVLPVVQTNSGWNTEIHVANMSESGGLTNVTVTLYGSGTQGFAGESTVINLQIRAGDVQAIDLSDHVEEGWVGSAYITSGADIGAVAERYKVDDQMLLSNTSRPEYPGDEFEGDYEYSVFGALVFKEYNFWNTGISVANTDSANHNNVTITYYGPTGNEVGQDTLTIPPRGQEYVYTPGSQELGLSDGFVGSVRIDGTAELHAAIDQVKYFGNDPDQGQAMSYSPTHWYETAWFEEERLSMPLVQKGNPNTGSGDTSGIQLYNANQSDDADADIVFYGANGLPVAPTVENNEADPIQISIPANGNYTLYTHGQSELSSGFQGSVVVDRTNDIELPQGPSTTPVGLLGVSNNVNYDVQGDGSVAFPMVWGWESGLSEQPPLDLGQLD